MLDALLNWEQPIRHSGAPGNGSSAKIRINMSPSRGSPYGIDAGAGGAGVPNTDDM